MKLAVVILNWNGREFLERFLPSVTSYSQNKGCRVIVADNGSTDDSVKFLKEEYPNLELILLDKNYGYAGGYNLAIEKLNDEYLLLLNSDVEVTKGWLNPLLQTMDNDELIAAAMPKIRSLNNPNFFEYAGAAGGFIDFIGLPYCRGRILSNIEEDKGQYDTSLDLFWATGAAMLVRRKIFVELGGFDSDFFAHMEEIDLCWRMKNSGYRVVCDPRSVVYHLGGGTLDNNSPYKLFLNFRNSLYMLYKNLKSNYLWPIIFLRMCFDGAVALIYLLTFKKEKFGSVFKAHIAFYKALPLLKSKRKAIKTKNYCHGSGFLPFIAFNQLLTKSR